MEPAQSPSRLSIGPRMRGSHSGLSKPSPSLQMMDASKDSKSSRQQSGQPANHHRHLGPVASLERHGKEQHLAESATELAKRITKHLDHTAPIHRSNSRQESALANEAAKEEASRLERIATAEQAAEDGLLTESRNRELKNVLQQISGSSMETTRKLDDLYYSILEKMSNIQSTIVGLQGISNQTKQLWHDFDNETAEMKNDFQGQIGAFNGFQRQKSMLESMGSRVETSKMRSDGLNQRLEDARHRVEALEALEAEVQATISMQFRIFWGILGVIVATLITLLVLHNLSPAAGYLRPNASDTITNATHTSQLSLVEVSSPSLNKRLLSPEAQTSAGSELAAFPLESSIEDDHRLRLLEEL